MKLVKISKDYYKTSDGRYELKKEYVFKALTEQESKEQEMFTLCCNYIYGIENSLDKVNKAFTSERYGIAHRERESA